MAIVPQPATRVDPRCGPSGPLECTQCRYSTGNCVHGGLHGALHVMECNALEVRCSTVELSEFNRWARTSCVAFPHSWTVATLCTAGNQGLPTSQTAGCTASHHQEWGRRAQRAALDHACNRCPRSLELWTRLHAVHRWTGRTVRPAQPLAGLDTVCASAHGRVRTVPARPHRASAR